MARLPLRYRRIEICRLRFDGANITTEISDVNITKKARIVDKNLQSKIMNLKSVFPRFRSDEEKALEMTKSPERRGFQRYYQKQIQGFKLEIW